MLTLALALALTPNLPIPKGANLIKATEIPPIKFGRVLLAEDGSAYETMTGAVSSSQEWLVEIKTGARTAMERSPLVLDMNRVVRMTAPRTPKQPAAIALWKRTGAAFTPESSIPETLPNLKPYTFGAAWPTKDGLTSMLLKANSNELYRATYRWRPPSVRYERIGQIPITAEGRPVQIKAIEEGGHRAILNVLSGNALWVQGSRLDYIGARYPIFWLGQVVALSRGKIERYDSDGAWRTLATGWTILGLNSRGTSVAFRRESDRKCFRAEYKPPPTIRANAVE